MKPLTPLMLLAFVVLAVGHLPRSVESNATENAAVPSNAEFAGKIVSVYISGPQQGSGQILEDVELITMGGRTILVGTGADTGEDDDWTVGVRAGIPWDSVMIYYAMTPQQFQKKIRESAQDVE